MSGDIEGWKLYERLIARLLANSISTELCVTPNARVLGKISERSRQLDVLIDSRHETDNSRRIIVDAKRRKRKIDVIQVEAFRGLMEDVRATHGLIVCPVGYTNAAERRAQESVRICLVPLERLQDFDPSTWPKCQNRKCPYGRVFWDGYPELSLGLKQPSGSDAGKVVRVAFVHYVGKCDRCGRFHVYCCTCHDLFSLDDDEGDFHCACKPPWFWLASVEEDKHSEKSAELHVVSANGMVMTTTRRPKAR